MKKYLSVLFLLFFMTLSGNEPVNNPEKTLFENFIKSCENDHGFACFRVADYYLTGKVVDRDLKKAEEYNLKGAYIFEIKCFNGSNNDCLYLANLYEVGKNVPVNYDFAAKIYYSSCNAGNCGACERLYILRYESKISPDSPYLICSEPSYIY